ncbi:cell division protein ZapB [Streptomyces roseolus]|uniref:cell division protein ZapB n=1 Tax=Streptomyces roseolus TaxID=67358 RepID=UPI003665933E
MSGFEIVQDFQRGTVTLAFDDVADFSFEHGAMVGNSAIVVLRRHVYEAHVEPAVASGPTARLRETAERLESRNLALINSHAKLAEDVAFLKAKNDELAEDIAKMEKERDEARDQRDAWKEAVEAMDAKHVRPLRQELAALKEQHEECRAQRRAARAAAGRFVVHPVFGQSADTLTQLGARHGFKVVDGAPAPSDVDELRAVVVSQAREIARLKGESE